MPLSLSLSLSHAINLASIAFCMGMANFKKFGTSSSSSLPP